MGITGLTKYIKDRHPNCYITCEASILAFRKVAIDTPIMMARYKSVNAEHVGRPYYNCNSWLKAFQYLVHSFRKNDIHPVFVFEGECPPEKNLTREKRRQDRLNMRNKTKALKESVQLLQESEMRGESLEIPEDLDKIWLKYLKDHKHPPESPFDLGAVSDLVQRRDRFNVPVRSRDYDKLEVLLKILGVPVIRAPMEAEALCSFLERSGTVDAVVSDDSDVLAYGCNRLIVDLAFSNSQAKDKITLIDGQMLRDSMGLSIAEFLDFCILCGTDFNKNISRVGPVSAMRLIQTHRSIDNIDLDVSILNHHRTREIITFFEMKTGAENKLPLLESYKEQCAWTDKPCWSLLIDFYTKMNIYMECGWMADGFVRKVKFHGLEDREECPEF